MRRQAAIPKKYEHIDFTPPEGVANAAAKGLELRQKASPSNRGGLTSEEAGKQGIGSGVQRAVNLKNRDTISPEVIKQMRGFLSRSEKSSEISAENKSTPWNDKGYVAWLLWGGDPAKAWTDKIIGQMEAADEKEKQSKQAALMERWGSMLVTADENEPTNPGLWEKVQALAKGEQASMTHDGKTINGPNDGKGFRIFPSAYANGWASKVYGDLGGGWKKKAKMPPRPLTPLSVYAKEILDLWTDAPPRAVAAITEMGKYADVWDPGAERAVQNVLNQIMRGGWRGPDAKRIRKELNSRLNYKRFDNSPWVKQRAVRLAGWWGAPYGQMGDGPADIMGPAVDRVRAAYRESWQREPTMAELYGALDFVTGPDRAEGVIKSARRIADAWGPTLREARSQNPYATDFGGSWTIKFDVGRMEPLLWTPSGFKDSRKLDYTRSSRRPKDFRTQAEANREIQTEVLDFIRDYRSDQADLIRGWGSRTARGKAKKDVGHGGLDEWFSGHGGAKGKGEDATWGDWVSISPVTKTLPSGKKVEKGDIVGECGISDDPDWKEVTKGGEDPLKCMPRQKAHDMPKAERAEKAKAKQKAEQADSSQGKKPTMTPTFDKKKGKKARLQRIQMKREAAARLRAAWGECD